MSGSLPPRQERDAVFISHSNPEDSAFATWLALRLALEGYNVWCDSVRLFGGDDFWKDIENAIRQQTRRFLFVASESSNQKQGTLQELAVASNVAKQISDPGFIIPLKIDGLPFADHNIQINRLIAVSFTNGWAEGLANLLRTLEQDEVPKASSVGPASVAAWWNTNRLNRQIVIRMPEILWTNWFPLREMPKQLFAWHVSPRSDSAARFPYPTYRQGDWLFSFADAQALTGETLSPTGGRIVALSDYLSCEPPMEMQLNHRSLKIAVAQLLRRGWESYAGGRGLPDYELSRSRRMFWFPDGIIGGSTVAFLGVNGKASRRDVSGYSTRTKIGGEKYKRHWHYGLEAIPILYPSPALALKAHVVFTLDGKTIYGDAKSQHRCRRSQCKDWWNDKWRDLMLAAVTWLSQGEEVIRLPVAPEGPVMESMPTRHVAEVGYHDEEVRSLPLQAFTGYRGDDIEDSEDAETDAADV